MSTSFARFGRVGRVAMLVAGVLLGDGSLAMTFGQAPWVAPAAEKTKKNPLTSDAKALERGEKVAQLNCVPCHGAKGKGDGVAAVALNPKPADWASPQVQADTDGELFWKISNGRGAMPSWKQLAENDRWAVIRYIRSLSGK